MGRNPRARYGRHPLGSACARSGFTIIEMVVVMVIIAIIGAVIIPSFVKTAVIDPTAQATQPIVQLLKFGKQSAAELGTRVRVVLDPTTGAYAVTSSESDTALASGMLSLPASTRIVTDSLRARFSFDPTGVTIADSLLVSSGMGSAIIRVSPWTGAVDVQRR